MTRDIQTSHFATENDQRHSDKSLCYRKWSGTFRQDIFSTNDQNYSTSYFFQIMAKDSDVTFWQRLAKNVHTSSLATRPDQHLASCSIALSDSCTKGYRYNAKNMLLLHNVEPTKHCLHYQCDQKVNSIKWNHTCTQITSMFLSLSKVIVSLKQLWQNTTRLNNWNVWNSTQHGQITETFQSLWIIELLTLGWNIIQGN